VMILAAKRFLPPMYGMGPIMKMILSVID
jgi:hypothetical protein